METGIIIAIIGGLATVVVAYIQKKQQNTATKADLTKETFKWREELDKASAKNREELSSHADKCPGIAGLAESTKIFIDSMNRNITMTTDNINRLCERIDAQGERIDETHKRMDGFMELLGQVLIRRK